MHVLESHLEVYGEGAEGSGRLTPEQNHLSRNCFPRRVTPIVVASCATVAAVAVATGVTEHAEGSGDDQD